MKHLNNKGFSLVEGLLIIIALAIVGGVSFYVYDANKDNEQTDNAALTQAESQSTSESKPVEPQKKYKEFKALGIKIIDDENIKDFDFKDSNGQVVVSSKEVKTLSDQICGKEADGGFLTNIQKVTVIEGDIASPTLIKDFGQFKIVSQSAGLAGFACSSNDNQKVFDLIDKSNTKINEIFKNSVNI